MLDLIKNARNKVVLDFNDMLDVKKYMFKELLKSKTNDLDLINNDFNYINSLDSLNPQNIDKTKISDISFNLLNIIFGGYISIISSKRVNEEFNFNNILCENEVSFNKYECNIYKKMNIKYLLNYTNVQNKTTLSMLNQLIEELDYFNANFYVFKLDDNRCLLLINSFFRLFFDSYPDKKLLSNLKINDFTSFPLLNALIPNETILTNNRKYKYDIHELNLESVEYINSL